MADGSWQDAVDTVLWFLPAEMWDALTIRCVCSNEEMTIYLRIDPEGSDDDHEVTCQRCGRSYRLMIQLRAPVGVTR
jgi:uncharacterized Zn-finger protein